MDPKPPESDSDDYVVEKRADSSATPAAPTPAPSPSTPAKTTTDSHERNVPTAAADWTASDRRSGVIKLKQPSPWPKRIAAILGVVVVVLAAKLLWPSSDAKPIAPSTNAQPATTTTTVTSTKRPEDFVSKARACGVMVPANFAPSDQCEAFGDVDKHEGMRKCTVDDDGRRKVSALLSKKNAVAGASIAFEPGESKSVADLFPSSIEFGALYPSTERVGGSEQAVRSEGDCDALDLVVDAACPRAMLQWSTSKGARVANPAPWPGCRVLAIWAFAP